MADRRQDQFRRMLIWSIITGCLVLLFGVCYRTLADIGRRIGRDFYYPYLSVYSAAGNALSDLTLLQYSKLELAERLQYLQNQNRILAASGSSESLLAAENNELRRLLNLDRAPEWDYVPAQVILRDPLYYLEQITLDRGERDGVRAGAAVFTVSTQLKPILVGVVREVSTHTADVVTVYSRRMQLSALFPSNGAIGLVNPPGYSAADGVLGLGFLPKDRTFQSGEELLTSGFESDIPPGLKIGNLVAAERPGSVFDTHLYLNGAALPAADLNRIRFVLVARRKAAQEIPPEAGLTP